MLSMIWSATQPANSKSARIKKKQPKTPNVLLSVHLRIAPPCYRFCSQSPLLCSQCKSDGGDCPKTDGDAS
jgi:hypothetical protein